MKIYSLQEENEKLNASRGMYTAQRSDSMFDMEKQKKSGPRTGRTASSASRGGKPVSSAPRGGRPAASVPQNRNLPSSEQQRTQQPRGNRRAGFLIFWFIFMIIIFAAGAISSILD